MFGKVGSSDPGEFRKNLPMYWFFFKERKKEVSEGPVKFSLGCRLSKSLIVSLIEARGGFCCEDFA